MSICVYANVLNVSGRRELTSSAVVCRSVVDVVVRPGLSLCVPFLCALMQVCVCVFVGLSGEPGQSVRCSNGGFKDKRCGEFPWLPFTELPLTLSPPHPPLPTLPLLAPHPLRR